MKLKIKCQPEDFKVHENAASNTFEIVVRDLSEAAVKKAEAELEDVKTSGYPNFFDDQRFGSYDPFQGFFGEKILKGHLNGALKTHLVSTHENDKPEEKDRKAKIFENWKKWRECCHLAAPGYEKEVFYYLVRKPSDFLTLLRQIPHEEMSLYLSAYQAFIWNELLRRLLKAKIKTPLKIYPGAAGDYLFYSRIGADELSYLEGLILQTLSAKTVMPDELSTSIHETLMKENGIERSLFNKIKVRQAFFKSTERNAIVRPEKLSWESGADELYPDSRKLVLKFELPRDAYATMLVKKLLADEK